MINASRIEQLTQKLKEQGDVSLEEVNEIYLFMKSLWKVASVPRLQSKFWELPILEFKGWLALENWYRTVTRKIEAGHNGNFIFSILLVPKSSSFYNQMEPIYEALKEHGGPEDLIVSIWTNEKAYSMFPKCLQNLFQWEESAKMYALQGDRVGFSRYPYVEDGKTYVISQFLNNTSLSRLLTLQKEFLLFSRASTTQYALEYLKQRTLYMEAMSMDSAISEKAAIFIDKKDFSIARKAFSVPFEELVKNALKQKIINKELAKGLLNSDEDTEWFLEAEFADACIKYIEEDVRIRLEWEKERKTVEYEPEWLEEIR